MKLTQKYMRCGLLATLAAVAGLGFTSCEDEPDKYKVADGVPTVYYVRSPLAESADSLLTASYTGSTVCLVGDNLRSVYELYFNDKKAILNTSYMTDHTLIVDIPKSLPDVVTDKIYMITKGQDTITFDFSITIPAPNVTAMSCEYAPAGSAVTITGDYFVNDPSVPLSVKFPGNVVVSKFSKITQSAITFEMPEVDTEGSIDVTTIYGTTTSSFHYKDTRGILFDFDGGTGLGNHGWHPATITSDETSITGNFVQLGNGAATMTAAGGWNDSNFAFEYWPGSWDSPVQYPEREGIRLTDLVDFNNFKDMAIKFELYVPTTSPWSAGALQIIVGGTDKVSMGNADKDIYGNNVAGCNNTYLQSKELPRALYRPWTSTGSFDTNNEWITVSLPISSSFIYDMDGSIASGSLTPDDFASLVLFVVSGGVTGTDCTPILKIDNIRAVSTK